VRHTRAESIVVRGLVEMQPIRRNLRRTDHLLRKS
jgi:hypothetical protein